MQAFKPTDAVGSKKAQTSIFSSYNLETDSELESAVKQKDNQD